MGPIIISDKSFIEMLSVDESVWLDQFFLHNITPVLYYEILCDLEKETDRAHDTKDTRVSLVATKTPEKNAFPNIFEKELIFCELLMGQEISMSRRPLVRAGALKDIDGKMTMQIEKFPEIIAQQRWQDCKFDEVEKIISKEGLLEDFRFDKWDCIAKNMLNGQRFKTLKAVRDYVNNLINEQEENNLLLMVDMFEISSADSKDVLKRYRNERMPSLKEFAPYSAYVFKIKLFLYLSIHCDLINTTGSYKKDILYLLYLPFCQIFVSNDKSHHKMVSLFLEEGQVYIKGDDLKKGIVQVNEYYKEIENEVNEVGIMQFVSGPPAELSNNIVINLWDKFCPTWRHARTRFGDSSEKSKIIEKIKETPFLCNSSYQNNIDGIDGILIARSIRKKRGRWTLFSK